MLHVFPFLGCCLLLALTAPVGAQPHEPMTAWHYPYTVHQLTVSDTVPLAYVDEGNPAGGTLLFIHGLGSNLQAWRKNIDGLSDRYRCLALDLPGYGKSGRGDYPFTMSFYADQVAAFVRELAPGPVTLVGHSMGGQVALELARRRPDWLQALVLAAPAGLETFSDTDRQFFATYVRPGLILATPPEQIEKNFDLNFRGGTPADARFMIADRMALRQDSAEYAYYARLVAGSVAGMLNEPVLDHLSEVDLPTLIAFGLEDRLIPNPVLHPQQSVRQVVQAGLDRLPDARAVFLPEAGHFVQWDQPEAFNRAVRDFLAAAD